MRSAACFNVDSGRQSVPERLAQLAVAAEISVPLSPGYIGQITGDLCMYFEVAQRRK